MVRNREKSLGWVRIVSGINGWSVLILAILSTGIALAFLHWPGILVGVGISVAGWMEIVGSRRIRNKKAHSWWWLGNSQILFFIVITIYSVNQLYYFSPSSILNHFPPSVVNAFRVELGFDQKALEEIVTKSNRAVYISVILCSFLYQGGLYLYYKKALLHNKASLS